MPGIHFQCKLCLILDTFRSSIMSFSSHSSHRMLQNFHTLRLLFMWPQIHPERSAGRLAVSGVGVLLSPKSATMSLQKHTSGDQLVWSFKLVGCVYLACVWPACNRGHPAVRFRGHLTVEVLVSLPSHRRLLVASVGFDWLSGRARGLINPSSNHYRWKTAA